MSKQKNKGDFNAMNMDELCRNVGFSKRIFENFASGNRLCSRKVLPVDPNFEKDQVNDAENLIIHDRLIPNPFSLKTVNNFNLSPPFGLFDLPPLH